MSNKHMKKCLTSLTTKEMQIKMALRFHLNTVRMAIIKKTTNAGEDVGKKSSYTAGRNEN
jgi:hypothetical protein